MCDNDDDKPYIPNENTVHISAEEWRRMNMGVKQSSTASYYDSSRRNEESGGSAGKSLGQTSDYQRDRLLVEREKTHGSFVQNANAWMDIREAMRKHTIHNDNNQQNLAIEMICLKLARMCYTPNVKDHWLDIAGYAKLGAEACD